MYEPPTITAIVPAKRLNAVNIRLFNSKYETLQKREYLFVITVFYPTELW